MFSIPVCQLFLTMTKTVTILCYNEGNDERNGMGECRMSKSKRLLELMMTVNRKRKFTVRELAEECGVSTRTILRDLQELSELGVPLYSEVGPHGGYQVLRERILPPIAFSEGEAVAMFFAYQSLQHYGALPFEAEAESALKKFYHFLPSDVKQRIDGMQDRVSFWTAKRPQPTPFLKTLLDAAVNARTVTIDYDSRSGTSTRDIQPIGVYAENGFWYAPSYCLRSGEHRLFRVDRILAAAVKESDDADRRAFTLKVWLSDHPEEPPTSADLLPLRVTLTRDGVRQAEATRWLHASIQHQEDGTGFIDTCYIKKETRYVGNVLFALGPEAKVEEPQEIIDHIRSRIDAMSRLYE